VEYGRKRCGREDSRELAIMAIMAIMATMATMACRDAKYLAV
jgi:hypothetical protein